MAHDDPLRLLTRSIEDLRLAATQLDLPPMRLEWTLPDPDLEQPSPEQRQRQAYVSNLLADYEGLRAGPVTWPLPESHAPSTPDLFLVGNLIRPGTTVMLAGPPGAAKSWASRQLALCAGAGIDYLDRYPIEKPLSVLVVDEDNGPREEWRREESILTALERPRAAVGGVRRVSLEGVKLDEEPWQRWLRGVIRAHELDLLILDPISEFHGGKELREDPSMRSVLAFLKRLKVDFPRLATVIVHHTRKLDAKDRTTARGLEDVRGQWGQTPDVVVVMSPLADRRTRWEVHKRVPHSSLLLEQIPEGQPGEGALRFLVDAEAMKDQREETDDKVLSAIEAGARTGEEIRIGTGLSKSGVYKSVQRLAASGLITKRAPYELVDDPTEDAL